MGPPCASLCAMGKGQIACWGNPKRKRMTIISLYVTWCNSGMILQQLHVQYFECNVSKFHWPRIECTDKHTVGERPQNVGFILSNRSTDVNRRDHLSYNLTVRLTSTSQKGFSSIKLRWKQTKSFMAKMLYPHNNSRIDFHTKLSCIQSQACKLQMDEKVRTVLRTGLPYWSSV